MKKLIFTLSCIVLLFGQAISQIPNFSFENWSSAGTYSVPDGWGTMNHATASFSVFTATRATPGNPGAAYLKLTSKTTGTTVTNGVAVSGILDTLTMQAKSGFACTLQPISFTGKWQHMIFGSSQGSLKVVLTKWNTTLSKRDTLAIAAHTLSGMAMSWANFNIPFNYLSSNTPDSCIIDLRASGANPTNQDYLWVDNLAFTGFVGLQNLNGNLPLFSVSPNPTNGSIHLNLSLNSIQNISISLKDVNGKVIFVQHLNNVNELKNFKINTSDFSKGVYLLNVSSDKFSESKKIIVE